MASSQFILFAGGPQWRLAIVRDAVTRWHEIGGDDPNRVERVSSIIKDADYGGEPLLIALSAARCMTSTLWIDGLPKNDFKARLYRLETQLPIEVERVVADFGPAGRIDGRECVLAVCSERAWLGKLIEQLEQQQIAVGPIVPAALLATQGQYSSKPPDELLLLAEPDQPAETLNLLELRAGRPLAWVNLPSTVGEVQTHLEWQSLQSQSPQRIELLGVNQSLSKQISQLNGWQLHPLAGLSADRAIIAASDILAARRKPLINLRRGPLAVTDRWRLQRKAINLALVAAAMLLLVSAIVLKQRAWRYDHLATADHQRAVALFQQTFPDWPVPTNVRAVIDSEYRKTFSGVSRDGRTSSALTMLGTVMTRIPATADVSIDHMTFTPRRFDLAGELKSYEAADALAKSIRASGMEISPPEAHRRPDGRWSFTLTGEERVLP